MKWLHFSFILIKFFALLLLRFLFCFWTTVSISAANCGQLVVWHCFCLLFVAIPINRGSDTAYELPLCGRWDRAILSNILWNMKCCIVCDFCFLFLFSFFYTLSSDEVTLICAFISCFCFCPVGHCWKMLVSCFGGFFFFWISIFLYGIFVLLVTILCIKVHFYAIFCIFGEPKWSQFALSLSFSTEWRFFLYSDSFTT